MSQVTEFSILSRFREYRVIFQESLSMPKDILVISDSNVVSNHFINAKNRLETLQISEEEKNLNSVMKVVDILQRHQIRRSSRVAFLGGGVIQDIGTLASSLYMRGIEWIYYPTTLQSMIDSCIGSKSSINFGTAKNLLGNYYPPIEIRIWPGFLSTLTKKQIVSGLIEGLKICAAGNCETKFIALMDIYIEGHFQSENQIVQLIFLSLETKKIFVEEDEFDQGNRRLLNYGHTFGHALESSSNYQLDHGIAVGIGIIAAHKMARDLGLLSLSTTETEKTIVKLLDLLGTELSENLNTINVEDFIGYLSADKKSTSDNFTFILPSNSGLVTQKLPLNEKSELLIGSAINSAILEVKK